MTEEDKKRVEETLYAENEEELTYLHEHILSEYRKRAGSYRGGGSYRGRLSALEGYQKLSGLINP